MRKVEFIAFLILSVSVWWNGDSCVTALNETVKRFSALMLEHTVWKFFDRGQKHKHTQSPRPAELYFLWVSDLWQERRWEVTEAMERLELWGRNTDTLFTLRRRCVTWLVSYLCFSYRGQEEWPNLSFRTKRTEQKKTQREREREKQEELQPCANITKIWYKIIYTEKSISTVIW